MFIRSKIQFFESKSQRQPFRPENITSCLSDQRYNFLKANHNRYSDKITTYRVVYQIKDTIFWKQITTLNNICLLTESCLSDQRYNFLKAIHNKHCISNFYTVLRNGLEPLCAKEVLFLLLWRVSLLLFRIDFNFKKQKTVSYSFLKRYSSEGYRFSTVSCESKSTKNPALSGGISFVAKQYENYFSFHTKKKHTSIKTKSAIRPHHTWKFCHPESGTFTCLITSTG